MFRQWLIAVALLLSRLGQQAVTGPLPEGWMVIRPPHEVCTLVVDGDTVWAGGRDGLFVVDRKTGALRTLPEGTPAMSYVAALLLDRKGRLWVAHLEGLSCLDSGEWSTWGVGKDGPDARPLSLLEDVNGSLWVGTERGVGRFQAGRYTTTNMPGDLGMTTVDVLFRDRDGVLWLGCASPTRGALCSCDGERWRSYGQKDGLKHLSINGIVQLRDGTLWVATGFQNQGGASRWMGDRFETWTTKDGLAGEKVRSIFEDRMGRVWFGAEYDGVAVLDGSDWQIIRPQVGLAGREVKVTVQDIDGVYWLGTDEGLSRIERWPPGED